MAKLSDLGVQTSMAADDILHVKPSAGNDLKITWANLVIAIQDAMEPVGTIKIFDANNAGGGGSPTGVSGAWVDDTTIPGWYACIAGNSDHGCPDLVASFLMGKVVAGAGGTGGANAMTITSAMLPTHTHAIDHDHPSKTSGGPSNPNTGNQSASHTHDISGHTHTTNIGSHDHIGLRSQNDGTPATDTSRSVFAVTSTADPLASSGSYTALYGVSSSVHRRISTELASIGNKVSGGSSDGDTGTQSASHTHDMSSHTHDTNIDDFNGSSGNGGFANNTFDNRPAYYTVIFIRKCA